MNNQQSGFTLIELVMVIVILGVLAVSAIPKFTDVSGAAEQAATDGIAGALGSGSAINYAVRSLNVANGETVATCPNLANTLEGGLNAAFTITAGAIANGATAVCTVTHTGGTLQTFTGHGIT